MIKRKRGYKSVSIAESNETKEAVESNDWHGGTQYKERKRFVAPNVFNEIILTYNFFAAVWMFVIERMSSIWLPSQFFVTFDVTSF